MNIKDPTLLVEADLDHWRRAFRSWVVIRQQHATARDTISVPSPYMAMIRGLFQGNGWPFTDENVSIFVADCIAAVMSGMMVRMAEQEPMEDPAVALEALHKMLDSLADEGASAPGSN